MVTPYNLNSEELYRQDVVPFHIVTVSKRWTLFLIGLESLSFYVFFFSAPQWRAADAEIKVPSGQNTDLKHSPFKAWSRSVYGRAC